MRAGWIYLVHARAKLRDFGPAVSCAWPTFMLGAANGCFLPFHDLLAPRSGPLLNAYKHDQFNPLAMVPVRLDRWLEPGRACPLATESESNRLAQAKSMKFQMLKMLST